MATFLKSYDERIEEAIITAHDVAEAVREIKRNVLADVWEDGATTVLASLVKIDIVSNPYRTAGPEDAR